MKKSLIFGSFITFAIFGFAKAESQRWWPEQKVPRAIVTATPSSSKVIQIMTQSIAGLAAQAVNEGRFDELVWIENNSPDYHYWYKGMINRLKPQHRGTFNPCRNGCASVLSL